MQTFMTSYTVAFNRRNRISCHLFQGRFKALLVEDESYGSRVSRYIHLNPVQVEEFSNLDIEQKINSLRQYKWSSYGALIGLSKCPKWIDRYSILKRWGKSYRERHKNYSE